MFIYKITNTINNKIYIGQTSRSIKERWNRHRWTSTIQNPRMPISAAIKKYGKENFKIEQIITCVSLDHMNFMEIYYTNVFNAWSPYGYNLKAGNSLGPYSLETREKISSKLKGRKISDETRKKLSESHKNIRLSEKTKMKLSIINKNKKPHENAIRASIKSSSKTYEIIKDDGQKFVISNMAQFCRDNNLSKSKMSSLNTGKIKFYKNFIGCKEI